MTAPKLLKQSEGAYQWIDDVPYELYSAVREIDHLDAAHKYFIKVVSGYRHVIRVISETDTHYTIERPLFNCWGGIFSHWGRKSVVRKMYVDRNFDPMSANLVDKYSTIQRNQTSDQLY